MVATPVAGRSRFFNLATVCVLCAAVSLPLIFTTPLIGDEVYHYPLAERFTHDFELVGQSYSSAYTPLSYIVAGTLMRIVGPHLWFARLLNLVVGILGIIAFHRIAQHLTGRRSTWPALFIACAPYYLRNCSVFYMGNYALVCVLWSFWLLWRGGGRSSTVLTGLLLGAATLCGQWALAVAGTVVLCDLATAVLSRSDPQKRRAAWWRIASVVLFQMPSAAVFAAWGGFTHPSFYPYKLTLAPTHVTAVLAVFGFTFGLWTLSRFRRTPLSRLSVGLLAIPLGLFALPEVSGYQGPTLFTGLTAQILGAASAAAGFDAPLLLAPAAAIGLVLMVILMDSARRHVLLALSALALLVIYASSFTLGETHMMMAVSFVFLLIYAYHECNVWLKLTIVQSAALGIAYAVYHSLVKFST